MVCVCVVCVCGGRGWVCVCGGGGGGGGSGKSEPSAHLQPNTTSQHSPSLACTYCCQRAALPACTITPSSSTNSRARRNRRAARSCSPASAHNWPACTQQVQGWDAAEYVKQAGGQGECVRAARQAGASRHRSLRSYKPACTSFQCWPLPPSPPACPGPAPPAALRTAPAAPCCRWPPPAPCRAPPRPA